VVSPTIKEGSKIMSSIDEQLDAIELSIEQAEVSVKKMTSLQTLTNNKEFSNIILDGYFKEEASRLVLIKAEPSMNSEEDQREIDKSIIAIGYFRQYLNTIMQMGKMSQKAMVDDVETRAELLANGEL